MLSLRETALTVAGLLIFSLSLRPTAVAQSVAWRRLRLSGETKGMVSRPDNNRRTGIENTPLGVEDRMLQDESIANRDRNRVLFLNVACALFSLPSN